MDGDFFVDVHCHLLPGVDDGAKTLGQAVEMARMACADGIDTVICTPHQLGSYRHNSGPELRRRVQRLQQDLDRAGVDLEVLPGADVRIEPDMVPLLRQGEVLSLADQNKHVLLELPHEIYFPLEGVLDELEAVQMVGVLSHPERNQGVMKQPDVLFGLVERGCLMQVTAGSLMGTFGGHCQEVAEWILRHDLCHLLATDAHGPKSRRPLMRRAFARAVELVGEDTAREMCCWNPQSIAAGESIKIRPPKRSKPSVFARLFSWGTRAA